MAAIVEAEDSFPEPTLDDLVNQRSLQWIFVGGKGGVGKTTTSCCVATLLASRREKVLIVSTDPAHNLSDAFGQKFGHEPSLVNGYPNLYCMEVEPSFDLEGIADEMGVDESAGGGIQNFIKDITKNLPGIDEAMSFIELMKMTQTMDFSVLVFDTAPTGHTLKLLSLPNLLDNIFGKLMGLKDRFGGMMTQMMSAFGGPAGANGGGPDMLFGRLETMRASLTTVKEIFRDPNRCTFVCVCIPEFLSLYETERLVQELTKYDIEVQNIVVNQVLFPEKSHEDLQAWYDGGGSDRLEPLASELIKKLMARKRMQDKYVGQIYDLYEDFHVVLVPLLDHEVRGVDSIRTFSKLLIAPTEDKDAAAAVAGGGGGTAAIEDKRAPIKDS